MQIRGDEHEKANQKSYFLKSWMDVCRKESFDDEAEEDKWKREKENEKPEVEFVSNWQKEKK